MGLTRKQQHARVQHSEWEEGYANKVDVSDSFISIIFHREKRNGRNSGYGTGFGFSTEYGVIPKEGDFIRLYKDFTNIRGLDVNGEPVFFWTDDDMEKRRQKWLAEREAEKDRIWQRDKDKLLSVENELPDVFKQRINWFREHCPGDFNKEYLSYEVMVCQQAVEIARVLKTPARVQKWIEGGYKRRKGLTISSEHSGNSLGMAARLAYNYVEDPRMVFFEHGALVPLVGCVAYGCVHPRPGIEEYAKEKGLEL